MHDGLGPQMTKVLVSRRDKPRSEAHVGLGCSIRETLEA